MSQKKFHQKAGIFHVPTTNLSDRQNITLEVELLSYSYSSQKAKIGIVLGESVLESTVMSHQEKQLTRIEVSVI